MEVKNLLFVGLVSLAIASSNARTTTTTSTESPRSSLFGDILSLGVDTIGIVSHTVKEIPSILFDNLNEKENITFNLYTKSNMNESYKLIPGDIENLEKSFFDPLSETKIIIHRLSDNSSEVLLDDIRRNYLMKFQNCNVIWINWKSESTNGSIATLLDEVKMVGTQIAAFIGSTLLPRNVDWNKIHLIGHSLDAHVAASVGHQLILNKIGKIGRITGLNPIGLQNGNDIQLDSSDAKFVDIIHTCIEFNRFTSGFGHVNIYPNGGYCKQPGCPAFIKTIDICGHKRSIEIFSESIKNPNSFVATRCDNWSNYKSKRCANNGKIYAGEYVIPGTTGHYFFESNEASPFGQGLDAIYRSL